MKLDIERIEHDGPARRADLHANRFGAVESRARKVHRKHQVVLFGDDGGWKALCRGGRSEGQDKKQGGGGARSHIRQFTGKARSGLTPPKERGMKK